MQIAADILNRQMRQPKYWPLSARQELVVSIAADDHLQYWADHDAWCARRHLNPLAQAVAERTANLIHVDEVGLRLLTADDAEIEARARKLVDIARRRAQPNPRDYDVPNEAEIKKRAGKLMGVAPRGTSPNPRNFDVPSVKRRLRKGVNRATIHAAAVLGLIGGPDALERRGRR
jgi:hypothetical protein